MIFINGKCSFAKIMTDEIDQTTRDQIQQLVDQPMFKDDKIVIMPDCHAGAGCVIGFTSMLGKYVVPNLIGVDIGCGVIGYNLGQVDSDFEKLDAFIKTNIPSGKAHRTEIPIHKDIEGFVDTNAFCLSRDDSGGKLFHPDKVLRQLGTLGGGNHFIEVGVSDEGDHWLFVHTGSRNFGYTIAKHHQKMAKQGTDAYFSPVGRNLEFIPEHSSGFCGYLRDMTVAQEFAKLNREIIVTEIIEKFFAQTFCRDNVIESVHNYIGVTEVTKAFHKRIIRKGAISACHGERCLIPFNMRDGVAICVGKGNPDWNFSAPHGAGRIMSRTQAREVVDADLLDAEMKDHGIYTTTAKLAPDEAPQAYKNKEDIIRHIAPTVDIGSFVKPVYNFKASE